MLKLGRPPRENCLPVLMFLLLSGVCPNAAAEDAESKYDAIKKANLESGGGISMAALLKYTNDPPRQLFLTEQLPITFPWHDLEAATMRLEILTEFQGEKAYTSCTATLISPSQVVTAAHCIPGFGPEKVIKAKVVSYNSKPGVLAQENIDLAVPPVLLSMSGDISVLALSEPFTSTFKPYPMKIRSPIQGETLVVISYPLGQAKRLSSGNCRVSYDEPPIKTQFFHHCVTFPGSSGALVVAETDGAVVGVHSESLDEGSVANTLTGITGLENLGVTKIAPPAAVKTSGWVLDSDMLTQGFAAAIRRGEVQPWLDVMINEKSNLNSLNKELMLTRTAIELDSVAAMNSLLSLNVTFSAKDASDYLASKAYGPWTSKKQEMLNYLLVHGAKPGRDPTTGALIFCGPGVLEVVKKVFEENGYGQKTCDQ